MPSNRLLMLAMLPAALFAAAPGFAQTGPSEASLRAIDQEQRRLVMSSDAEGLGKILHPNMVINGPDGRVVTREMFLESTRTGAVAKQIFERVPEAVRITGNIGVLVGHENIVAAPGSRDFVKFGKKPFQRRYTNVFLFEEGRWLFLARQASIVLATK
jgi:hypothetical protein